MARTNGYRYARTLALAAVFGLMTAGATLAHDPEAEDAGPNQGRLSFSAGIDFTTHYFFRGIFQEDQGLIAQPWAEVGVNLYEGDQGINSIDLTAGVWESFHDGPTGSGDSPTRPEGASGDPESWYESDIYFGLGATVADVWSFGVTWTAYTGPNDRFNTIEDINFTIGFDDSELLGAFALSPYVSFIFEVDDEADAGNSAFMLAGSGQGTYMELGIEPSFNPIPNGALADVSISIPVTVGLSLDDYYEADTTGPGGVPDGIIDDDESFGYLDVGVVLGVPLTFIPSDFGSWSLSTGVHLLFLGDTTETFNGGEDFEAVGVFGISMEY